MIEAKGSVLARTAATRRWREADARIVVEAWRKSGLPQAQFAREHKLHPIRFGRWVRRLGGARTERQRFTKFESGVQDRRTAGPRSGLKWCCARAT
ncbi:MAG: IS66 family insertion sequence element accessory protein TnpA [Gemmatimonadota bacterium]